MNPEKRVNHPTAEFKARAVRLLVGSAQPFSRTAKELGVNKNTLHTWIGKYHRAELVEEQASEAHLYEELKRLEEENARLKEEWGYSKEGRRVLCQGKRVKYALTQRRQGTFTVTRMCKVVEVCPSGLRAPAVWKTGS